MPQPTTLVFLSIDLEALSNPLTRHIAKQLFLHGYTVGAMIGAHGLQETNAALAGLVRAAIDGGHAPHAHYQVVTNDNDACV